MSLWNSTFKNPGQPLKRSAWKTRAPKKRVGQDKPALLACKGAPCYLRVSGVCLGDAGRGTVVPCHSNQQIHGKGMGIKADDRFTVPGCMACHRWLDQGPAPKDIKFSTFNRALAAWVKVRDSKKPEATVEVGPGGVQQVHGDEIMRNVEIVSEKASMRQGGVA